VLFANSDEKMSSKRSVEPSPESIARANRQRLAAEEGARAMADLERQAVEIRKNMERLRTLREAKEAEGASKGQAFGWSYRKPQRTSARRDFEE
jgi:hypothetical protein